MHKISKKTLLCPKAHAFSLVEVTISLIVVGVLLAALSPVISKKIQGTSVIAGAGATSNGRSFTPDPNDPDCQNATDGSNAVDCKIQIPAGVNMINVSMLSGGGGGAGATSSTHLSNQILQGSTSLTITNGIKNVKITNLKGGGGGGGSANSYQYLANKDTLITSSSFTIPSGTTNLRAQLMGSGGGGGGALVSGGQTDSIKSQADCDKYAYSLFVPASYNGTGGVNLCVKRRNVGDTGGPSIAPGYSIINNPPSNFSGNNYACFKGTTSSTECTASGGGSSYSGCTRTVCNRTAGEKSCALWAEGDTKAGDWRIPTYYELAGWAKIIKSETESSPKLNKWMGTKGLEFCGDNKYVGNSIPNCHARSFTMSVNTYFLIEPNCVFGGVGPEEIIETKLVEDSSCGNPFCPPKPVAVHTGKYNYYPSYLSTSYYQLSTDKDSGCLLGGHASVRCVLPSRSEVVYASVSGGGGGGGAALNLVVPDSYLVAGNTVSMSVGTCAAGSGGASCAAQFTIKNSSATTYGLQAYGGNAGGSASAAAAGTGGTGSSTCRRYLGSWSNISCSAAGKNGSAGSITSGGSSYIAYSGGIGGNGAGNTSVGKGGNGAGTTSSGTTTSAAAGNIGYARFYYDRYIAAPISGGGGGSGATINNITIPQSILDANIGGKIEIKSGAGGTFGTSNSNGNAGSESYVVVKNSSGVIKWGYKTLGGSGGGAATTSAGGVGGAGGGCQYHNGTSWNSVSCTTNGIKGGNGAKSANGNAVAAGASVGSGYGASGAGAINTSSNGTSGAAGIAQISYDRFYQAAAGGGGGAGAYAQVKGIKVIPLKTYTVRIGKGGVGGAVGAKGQDGGMTRVVFDAASHVLSGGLGGNSGTSQSADRAVVHGTGGQYGKVTTSVSGVTYKNGTSGASGASSGFNSIGGVGATSGIDTPGACGGLFSNPVICQNTSVNGSTITYKLPRNLTTTPAQGSAGAGGGGGGWNNSNYTQSGKGSNGLDGFLHIWWQTYK